MDKKEFKNKEEFDDFIEKINLIDVILLESSSKVLSVAGRNKNKLQTDISLNDSKIEVIHNPENENDIMVLCSKACNFIVKDNKEEFLNIFANFQAVYQVSGLELSNKSIEQATKYFVEQSAYVHIVSYLRVFIGDIVNKSGYPRYVLPLFKQPKDGDYVQN